MFIEERHQQILKTLNDTGRITTAQIEETFGVSYDSAKRDLRILEEKGLLKRTHGGALPIRSVGAGAEIHHLSAAERVPVVKENYQAIAREAANMIRPQDVVFVTGASIGYLLVRSLPQDLTCTIVTNSISIAAELRRYPQITTIMTGGEMHPNGSFYDEFTLSVLRRIRFDKCFITSSAISANFGLSIHKSRNVGVVNTVLAQSQQCIGLYPTEKVGFDSIISICPASKLDVLITNWDVADKDLERFGELGIEVRIAEK